jgi:hypothetical protein
MPINYPAALDAFPNPGATTRRNDPGFELDVVVSNLNDAVEALETKVGIGASTPSAGQVLTATAAGSALWLPVTVAGKNGLLNGGMETWPQGPTRAVGPGTTGKTGYGPARWCLATGANQASTIDRVAGLTVGSQYAARVRRNAGQPGTGAMAFEQALLLHEIVPLRSQLLVLGFDVVAGSSWSPAGGNLLVYVASGTGSAARRGTAAYPGETALINELVPITTAAKRVSCLAATPLPAAATQLTVQFQWAPAGTAGAADDVTLDNVMLNGYGLPMPFRPRDNDETESLRYYRVLGVGVANESFTMLQVLNTTTAFGTLLYGGEPMIGTPTLGTSPVPSDFYLTQAGSSGVPVTSLSSLGQTNRSARIQFIVAAGLVAGNATELGASNGNARFFIDSEI